MKVVRVFLILNLALVSALSWAHSPSGSTYAIRSFGDVCVLEGSFAQATFDAVLINRFGEDAVFKLDQDEVKHEIVNLVRNNIRLRINGAEIELGEAGIKLGSHQTDIKFVINHPIRSIETVEAEIKPFEGIPGHQNLLRVFTEAGMHKIILDKKNNFNGRIDIAPKVPVAFEVNILLIIAGIIIAASCIGILIYRKRNPHLAHN